MSKIELGVKIKFPAACKIFFIFMIMSTYVLLLILSSIHIVKWEINFFVFNLILCHYRTAGEKFKCGLVERAC